MPPAAYAALVTCACATNSAGCHQEDDVTPASSQPTAAAPTVAPKDHLVPGELLEGPDRAFGLPLPRGSHVESTFPQQIIATCSAKASDVANYVRPRVAMGSVAVGAASTMFERVQSPANPGRELVIRVEEAPLGRGSRIIVRDVTPPPLDPSLTDEQRWRQAGMKPGGGGVADPTHLQ